MGGTSSGSRAGGHSSYDVPHLRSRYRLIRGPAAPTEAPRLDASQRAVVEHGAGPLLVLAGPGTGKTTTLVEAIAERIEARGADPESVLALTFSRKAAEQLRDRVTARLGRTLSSGIASTFHSFAYALVRHFSPPSLYTEPLHLLSAPEQDVVIADLLAGPEAVRWPDGLRAAVGTRGFARELQDLLARARERGLDADALRRLGQASGREEYSSAGDFLEAYLVNLDFQSALDYAGLVDRAVAEAAAHRDQLRGRYRHVFVDEYQDTDPSQVALLRELVGPDCELVVVGDPDQSIYGFRGADVRGILDFPAAFPQRDGSRAEVVALQATRRFGPRILTAVGRISSSIGVAGSIDARAFAAFRSPEALAGAFGDGRVEVTTYDTVRSETEHVADLLRRAHLEDGLAWSDMAVLVRSGRTSIPSLRRSLVAAGVPVEVASDDTPLVREPAVLPLLDALHAVANLDNDDPAHRDYLDPTRAEALLLSPLAGLDAIELRALARALRVRDKQRCADTGEQARPSADLVREAVLRPDLVDGLDLDAAAKVRALGALLHTARELIDEGGTVEQSLWRLWSGTSWPRRLARAVDAGGPGARLAHRDLDAICALFDAAARAEEHRGHTSVTNFLETLRAQEIPADTLAEKGVRGDAVRLLTAHRSKGLEWRLVVVAHVQEEAWPDLRRRTSLLQADRLGDGELLPPQPVRETLNEERRLFYVACTRARQRLVVTAVASPDDDGEQPSRFLTELGVSVEHVAGRPRRPLSLAGMVADLRRTVTDPATSPGLRDAAARRLARLSREEVAGRPLVPAADPAGWWGLRGLSRAQAPVRPDDQPVVLSASALAGLLECPARWFLEREAGGSTKSSASQGFGNVVHAIADLLARGELDAGEGDLEAQVDGLMQHVDAVWEQLAFRTPWSSVREREELRAALARFIAWHQRPEARTLLATEEELDAEVVLPDGQVIRLHGYADRLEVDDDGRVVVVDLKTGKYPPTDKSLAENPQLGLYQYAVDHGAADRLLDAPGASGGAELWQLRKESGGRLKVQGQPPHEPDGEEPLVVETQLMQAARALREERFDARPGSWCERCAFRRFCPAKTAGTVLS
ncbi:MAG TPA: ATP-dependent DNA helicase [Marmoricola sp.]|nr:ATP-dependent DNA helicase [Marmoricola sp.]